MIILSSRFLKKIFELKIEACPVLTQCQDSNIWDRVWQNVGYHLVCLQE